MMAEAGRKAECKIFQGRPASTGFASGPIFNARQSISINRIQGSREEEKSALTRAITEADEEVSALAATADDEDIAAILEFQSAFLEDDALAHPALALIEQGQAAHVAFQKTIDELAGEYEVADDEYFAARGSDIRDLGARVLRKLSGEHDDLIALPGGAIYLADDITPTDFLNRDWQGHGLLLRQGSPTAHVSMLARAKRIPMIVGLGDISLADGEYSLVDADAGTAIANPDKTMCQKFEDRKKTATSQHALEDQLRLKPAITASGERVSVHINIADAAELDGLEAESCDGIGLVRTELLFHDRAGLPGEEQQYAVYCKIIKWAQDRPVTIRTLDAGGDKPIAGLTIDGEENPFLGLRGVRLSLANTDVFKVQLRALLRAAIHGNLGNLQIMIPMVSVPAEMDAVKTLLDEARDELTQKGEKIGEIRLGMMVEVPSVILTLGDFDVDFVSIGSNDLTQYIMAAGRDASTVAHLADTAQPAVLAAIKMVVDGGNTYDIPVSLCGDAGGDVRLLPLLLDTGLRSVSVAPSALGQTKYAISQWEAA